MFGIGETTEKFLTVLAVLVAVGLVVANAKGTKAFFDGVGGFTSQFVGAFSGGKGFISNQF